MIHLVRHGETASYDSDAGLTARGVRQSSEYGVALARSLAPGTPVEVRYAPTERARATAESVHKALAEAGLPSDGCHRDDGFRNLYVSVDGRELEPTQAHALLATSDGGWAAEARRFWRAHEAGDAMGFWLHTPLLWHEPPASVVRRLLTTAASLTAPGHVVVATHSGCLRALVAWAAGEDLGEPENAEEVRLAVSPAADRVTVGYRADDWTMPLPR
ncbi:histidine phosphatase family protein [Pseudonocardia acaciae]|uniref:histidine phosphatase family protein n=1 Tax=Pseudonocardia acaciae TaxID=551276 RepID=UPI0004917D34|nr:histidine phosphatase family protein [Pseudonocardia acaciae]